MHPEVYMSKNISSTTKKCYSVEELTNMKSIANNHLPFSIHETVQKVNKDLFDLKYVLFFKK